MKAKFWFDCTSASPQQRAVLAELKSRGREITVERFMRITKAEEVNNIARSLGYYVGKSRIGGMRLKDDCYVKFFTATVNGKKLYWLEHSSIEFVFKEAV